MKLHLRSGAARSIGALLLLSVLVVAVVVVLAPTTYDQPTAGVISVSPSTVDLGQSATLSITTTPSSPYAPYTCEWLVEPPGGSYKDLVSSDCSSPVSTGAGALTSIGTWSFELNATASGYATVTSNQVTVTVDSALTAPSAPTVSAASLYYENQTETVTGTIPSTGTPTYSWQWLVQVNGAGGYSDATLCAVNSGSGAVAGNTETCTIAAGTPSTPLAAGDTYSFELQVTDSASETATSSASPTVTVLGLDQSFTLSLALKTEIGTTSVFEADWTNNVPSTPYPQITGIVWFVVMNLAGTVMITATSLTLQSGASAPAYLGLATLAPGSYTIETFVSTTLGVALSLGPTEPVTIS